MDDLINRAVNAAFEELRTQFAQAVERRLASELAGTRHYFSKPRISDAQILERFNGRNAKSVARELGVDRATVYRAIQRARNRD